MNFEQKIWYAGKEVSLVEVADEKQDKYCLDTFQYLIDHYKLQGKKACCLHNGDLHAFYLEKVVQ